MNVSFDVVREMTWRGLLNQTTDEKINEFLSTQRTVYNGFDPTADSLHVGHLVAVMNLRRFQRAGHKPIALVGGATGMIGDPSGRSSERNLQTLDQIQHNVECIQKQLARFINFDDDAPNKALLVNNYEWTKGFSYLEFLRDIGKLFQVNVMLTKDSVKSRLDSDSGLSYTEFSYMLLQSYDFVHLHRAYGCEVQIGGSDQWGNITAGIELARKMDGVQLYGLTSKLLLKSDGKKMGKSESGALWLDPEKTSPYQFYQYWINVDDADIENAFRFFTDLNQEEANALIAEHQANLGKRILQKQVAKELTTLAHGQEGLQAAQRATDIFFGAEISQLSDAELTSIFADVPSQEFSREKLDHSEMSILDAFVAAGLAKTKSDARRAVQQGGAYLNNRAVTDVNYYLSLNDLASETVIILRSGKKRYALLKFV